MKQHKRAYASTAASTGSRGARRPYEFTIWRERTISALREYLAFWHIARGIVAGRTTALYLNREGEAYDRGGFGNSFMSKKHYAAREWQRRTGEDLPILDRYAHRHLMGEYLRRHIPGGSLKTWYLTHRSDGGSDRNYGDDDAALLHECIDEVLAGKPPRPKQEAQRWEQQGAQFDQVVSRLNSVTDGMEFTKETLMLFKSFLAERERSNPSCTPSAKRQPPA